MKEIGRKTEMRDSREFVVITLEDGPQPADRVTWRQRKKRHSGPKGPRGRRRKGHA